MAAPDPSMPRPAFENLLSALAAEYSWTIQTFQQENAKLRMQLERLQVMEKVHGSGTSSQQLNTPIKGAASFTSEATSHGSKQKVGKVATCQLRVFATPSECSMADLPLFLSEPQSSSAVKDDEEDSSGQIKRWRQMLEHPRTNLIVTCLICLNTAFLACDMQVKGLNRAHQHNYLKETAPQSSSISDFFKVAEQTFTLIFLVELIIRIAVLQSDFFRIFNFIDVVAVTVSIVFWAFPAEYIFNPMMIRLVRLVKLGKAWTL